MENFNNNFTSPTSNPDEDVTLEQKLTGLPRRLFQRESDQNLDLQNRKARSISSSGAAVDQSFKGVPSMSFEGVPTTSFEDANSMPMTFFNQSSSETQSALGREVKDTLWESMEGSSCSKKNGDLARMTRPPPGLAFSTYSPWNTRDQSDQWETANHWETGSITSSLTSPDVQNSRARHRKQLRMGEYHINNLEEQFRNTQITNQPSTSNNLIPINLFNELSKMPSPTQFYEIDNINLRPSITNSQLQATDFSPGSSLTSQANPSTNSLYWIGELPVSNLKAHSSFSSKIFVGGIPWDITDGESKMTFSNSTVQFRAESLTTTFSQFGLKLVDRPSQSTKAAGYVYLLFENGQSVRNLLLACEAREGSFYLKLSSPRLKRKKVQIVPWLIDDSNYSVTNNVLSSGEKTVFVGALHGKITAEGLATVMCDLFGKVTRISIDIDKNKYPIGSGRVTFESIHSYVRAIQAAFVNIKTSKFTKRIQIDPYLSEDANCEKCKGKDEVVFCRELTCLRYYCKSCWEFVHVKAGKEGHRQLKLPPQRSTASSSKFCRRLA